MPGLALFCSVACYRVDFCGRTHMYICAVDQMGRCHEAKNPVVSAKHDVIAEDQSVYTYFVCTCTAPDATAASVRDPAGRADATRCTGTTAPLARRNRCTVVELYLGCGLILCTVLEKCDV